MSVFGDYASYYDLLYRDKNYAEEVDFIDGLIQQYGHSSKTLLDLGCGTGTHASLFARRGYEVTGIDMSADMIARARERSSTDTDAPIDYRQGDIRTIKLDRQFDVIVVLFHVVSYLPANDDLDAAFSRIREHLKPGGLLLFDCWYGPGVLLDPPTQRVKRFEDDHLKIIRSATPALLVNDDLVDVQYDFIVLDKATRKLIEFSETHRMRYLFWPELAHLLARHGLRAIKFNKWLCDDVPDSGTWNSFVLAT